MAYMPPRLPICTLALLDGIQSITIIGGTLVHTSSGIPTFAIAVAALDAVVRGVVPAVPHRLPQLDGARSPMPVTN
jgi:hypothetical protein